MINTVIDFTKNLEQDEYVVRDYTSINFVDLYSFLSKDEYADYFTYIDVYNDEKIENLSYRLYRDENYADVILACNNERYLFGMPNNTDILLTFSDLVLYNIMMNIQVDTQDPNAFNDLSSKIQQFTEDINLKKRTFKVPKFDKLNHVISLIEQYKNENSVSTETIEE